MACFTRPPVAVPTDTSVTVSWETDIPGIGQLCVGIDPNNMAGINLFDNLFVTAHAITAEGLTTGTTYYYVVNVYDTDGNVLVSTTGPQPFVARTPATARITDGPYADPCDQAVCICWMSDTDSTGKVELGTDPATLDIVSEDGTVSQDHDVTVPALQPSTKYHYRVSNLDLAGGTLVQSAVASFTTDNPVTGATLRRCCAIPPRVTRKGTAKLSACVLKNGAPVANDVVTFELLTNNGRIQSLAMPAGNMGRANTDTSGRAEVAFTAGDVRGMVRIRVSSASTRNKAMIHLLIRRR